MKNLLYYFICLTLWESRIILLWYWYGTDMVQCIAFCRRTKWCTCQFKIDSKTKYRIIFIYKTCVTYYIPFLQWLVYKDWRNNQLIKSLKGCGEWKLKGGNACTNAIAEVYIKQIIFDKLKIVTQYYLKTFLQKPSQDSNVRI